MAGKPFLSRLRKWKKSNKGKPKESPGNSQTVGSTEMARRYTSSSSSSASAREDAPPLKKRKTGEERVEEEWDDLEFTQADLDDLEIQASQAYAETSTLHQPGTTLRSEPQQSTSHGQPRTETDTSGKFVRPLLSNRSSTSSSSAGSRGNNPSCLSNQSHLSYPGGGSRNLNKSDSSSSSSSGQPESLSSYGGSRTSSSLHSTGSEEIPLAQRPGSLSRGISSDSNFSMDVSGMLSRDHSLNLTNGNDVPRLRQESLALKLQVDKLKEDLCAKDGEINVLRDNLKRRETDLDKMKSEKISQISQQNKQQTDKEKSLQVEINRMKTQFEFSEQEKRELGARCRDLEGQIRNLQVGPSSSQALPATQTSPVPRRVPVEKRESPKSSSSFPSKTTFHAAEGSPRKQAKGDKSVESTATMTSSSMRKRHQINVPTSCRTSGNQLVARLLHITPSSTGRLSDRGIVGLLQTPTASATAQSVAFDRDKDTSLLSPCRRRISDVQTLLEAQEKPETSSIVSVEHFSIAVRGLTQMLEPDRSEQNSRSADTDVVDRLTSSDNHSLDQAVLILPLLNDYLSHYLKMIESSNETFEASPSTASSSSGSFDSSVESSLGVFLKDSTTYANNLESLALASLRTLHILTSCRSVRTVLLSAQSTEEISDSSRSNRSEKQSTFTALRREDHRVQLGKDYLEDLHLLKKLIKLADPGRKGHLFNVEIVKTSLNVLSMLASHADEQQLLSLRPVISEEVIHNCLECESEPTVICHCLELLKSLVKSNIIVSGLCMNASECVLLCLYHVCIRKSFLATFTCDIRLQIFHQVFNLLSSIASLHKGGLTIVLESDCECSVEIVESLVILLYNVLKLHKERNDDVSFSILQRGILLLHQMYQHEVNFTHRHSNVQHQYFVLIVQLNRIFRNAGADKFHNEISAIQDLWDFTPDEDDYQSCEDEAMDSS